MIQNNIESANKFKNVLILENLKMLKVENSTIQSLEDEVDILSNRLENLDSILQKNLYSKTENELGVKNSLLVLKKETVAQLTQNLYDFSLEDEDIEELLSVIKIKQ